MVFGNIRCCATITRMIHLNMKVFRYKTKDTDSIDNIRTDRMKQMKSKKQILIKLFISTLYLSTFTFGGGYVIVTLMKKKFVDEYHWIDENEMLDLIAIAQSSPGAIAVNGAIVVGYKLVGIIGAITAIIATILPPLVIISVISVFYNQFHDNVVVSQVLTGMQAAVGAIIADVVYGMASGVVKEKKISQNLIMIAAFVATCFFGVPVYVVILICILLGTIQTCMGRRKKT